MHFSALIQNYFNTMIKLIRTGNGQELLSHKFQNYLRDHGIIYERTCVETTQQNGVAERKHRHLLNVARSLRFQAHLPLNFGVTVFSSLLISLITPRVAFSKINPLLNFFLTPHPAMLTYACSGVFVMLKSSMLPVKNFLNVSLNVSFSAISILIRHTRFTISTPRSSSILVMSLFMNKYFYSRILLISQIHLSLLFISLFLNSYYHYLLLLPPLIFPTHPF